MATFRIGDKARIVITDPCAAGHEFPEARMSAHDAQRIVPTVGENRVEMEHLFLQLCGLSVSKETVAGQMKAADANISGGAK